MLALSKESSAKRAEVGGFPHFRDSYTVLAATAQDETQRPSHVLFITTQVTVSHCVVAAGCCCTG